MEWNAVICSSDYAELARACLISSNAHDDETLTAELISAIGSLCAEMNIPNGFSEFGLSEKHFGFIIKNCRSNSMKNNPQQMSDEDVIRILRSLMET